MTELDKRFEKFLDLVKDAPGYVKESHINKQQGVLNARVQIIDFKNIVDLPQEEIERLRFYPGYREAKALWDTFHECCCCRRIAPVVHDCIWKGEKSRACEDCLNKYARFKV
jgi:hypothetical protein